MKNYSKFREAEIIFSEALNIMLKHIKLRKNIKNYAQH